MRNTVAVLNRLSPGMRVGVPTPTPAAPPRLLLLGHRQTLGGPPPSGIVYRNLGFCILTLPHRRHLHFRCL
jgi:hypothetical protein